MKIVGTKLSDVPLSGFSLEMHDTTLSSLKTGIFDRESFYKNSDFILFCLSEMFGKPKESPWFKKMNNN